MKYIIANANNVSTDITLAQNGKVFDTLYQAQEALVKEITEEAVAFTFDVMTDDEKETFENIKNHIPTATGISLGNDSQCFDPDIDYYQILQIDV